MRRSEQKTVGGFTIIELLIATAVFAVVITIVIGGFVQISRTFYKALVQTQTQQNLRQIVDKVSSDIRAATFVSNAHTTGNDSASNTYYQCIGSNRYTYILHKRVDLANHNDVNKFGILLDYLPGSSACSDPFSASGTPLQNPTELLADNMRLNHFVVSQQTDNEGWIYQVDVSLAYGRDQFLTFDTAGNAVCDSTLSISQFCAVSQIATSVAGLGD